MTALARRGSVAGLPIAGLVVAAMLGLAGVLGAFGGREPILALAAVAALGVGAAIVLRPEVAVPISIGAIYMNVPVVLINFHGVPGVAAVGVILLLGVPLAEDLVIRHKPVVVTPALPWIALLSIVMLASTVAAEATPETIDGIGTFAVEGALLFVLVSNVVRDRARLERTTWTLVAVGALLGCLSLHQQVTQNYGSDYFGFAQAAEAVVRTGRETLVGAETQPRLTGPIGEENRYGQVMLMLVPLGLALMAGGRTRTRRLVAAGLTACIAVGIILTFSRGAAVSFAGIMVLAVVFRLIGPRLLLIGVLAVIGAIVFVPGYANRLVTIEELTQLVDPESSGSQVGGAIRSRATEAGAAALVFADHPVLGVGPGMFPVFYRQYALEIGIRVQATNREAHNLYLGLAADLGLAGLLTFSGAIGATLLDLRRARRAAWQRYRAEAHLATGYALALVAYLASGMFLHLAFIRYLWLMVGVAAAAGVIIRRLAAEGDDDDEPPATEAPALSRRTASR